MKELTIKIKYEESNYKGHGEDVSGLILEGIKNFMEIDLEHDSVIAPNWEVKIENLNLK